MFRHAVRMKTRRPIERFEAWLQRHCRGQWHIRLEDICDDLENKVYLFAFEREEDYRQFRAVAAQPRLIDQYALAASATAVDEPARRASR